MGLERDLRSKMKELVAIQKEEGRNTELMSRFLVRMIQGMV